MLEENKQIISDDISGSNIDAPIAVNGDDTDVNNVTGFFVDRTDEQAGNNKKKKDCSHLAPWQYKPGQCGNPLGRKAGTVSLKEYAKKMLKNMTEEERQDFMKGLSKDLIWKMAEGMPDNKSEITGADGAPIVIQISKEIADKNNLK